MGQHQQKRKSFRARKERIWQSENAWNIMGSLTVKVRQTFELRFADKPCVPIQRTLHNVAKVFSVRYVNVQYWVGHPLGKAAFVDWDL